MSEIVKELLESRIQWCHEACEDLDNAITKLSFVGTDFLMLAEKGARNEEFNAVEKRKIIQDLCVSLDKMNKEIVSYGRACKHELYSSFDETRQSKLKELHRLFTINRDYRLKTGDGQVHTFTVVNTFCRGGVQYIVTAPDWRAHEVQVDDQKMEKAIFTLNGDIYTLSGSDLVHNAAEKEELGLDD